MYNDLANAYGGMLSAYYENMQYAEYTVVWLWHVRYAH